MRPLLAILALLLAACTTTVTPASAPVAAPVAETQTTTPAEPAPPPPPPGPTAEDAAKFASEAEARLAAMNVDAQRAAWVQATYITDDTQVLAAKENEKLINAGVELAKGRSEERRVGKECRSRWAAYDAKKK